ncbi:MAG TPA: hypothetical protein VLM38_15315 [Blastocatellia bacterium]|nr:hypothetical protein [Blastocatellia bacterium]
MLMVTEDRTGDVLTLKLAGVLAGDWTNEVRRSWRDATSSIEASRVIVTLSEVTFIDDRGKELLSLMMKEGAELIASDILTKSIVEEITVEAALAV